MDWTNLAIAVVYGVILGLIGGLLIAALRGRRAGVIDIALLGAVIGVAAVILPAYDPFLDEAIRDLLQSG